MNAHGSLQTTQDSWENYAADIDRSGMMSPAEERALLKGLAFPLPKPVQDRLVTSNLRFVVDVARRHQRCGVSLEDLVQEGNLGLIEAATRFDPEKGFRFISYAVWWIRQRIMIHLDDQVRPVRMPHNISQLHEQMAHLGRKMDQDLGRHPTQAELTGRMPKPEWAMRAVLAGRRAVRLDERASAVHNESTGTFRTVGDSTLTAPQWPTQEEELLARELFERVDQALTVLDGRSADMLRRTHGLAGTPETYAEIGQDYQMTRQRVAQIEIQAMRRLGRNTVIREVAQELGIRKEAARSEKKGNGAGAAVPRPKPSRRNGRG